MADDNFGAWATLKRIKLETGQDLDLTLRRRDLTDWPAGAAFALIFDSGVTINAVVSGPLATFSANYTVVDPIESGTKYRVTYADSSGRNAVPYAGTAQRRSDA